jgi:hypothetical protein
MAGQAFARLIARGELKTKEFWVSAIVFMSKDENLTKAHVI